MSKRMILSLVLVALVATAAMAQEKTFTISKDDTIRSVLLAHQGERVTLHLDDGSELSGVVETVGEHVVHLRQLTGKEFYDAVVDLEEIAAVVLRVR